MGMLKIRRISQRLATGVVVILVVAMGAGLFFVAPKLGQSNPDYNYHGPAVRVNGITLKDEDFRAKLNEVYQQFAQYRMYGLETSEEQMREEALQLCIKDLVVQAEIDKKGIKVANSDVDNFFNRWSKQFPTKDERYNFYQQYGIENDRTFKDEIRRYLEEQRLYLAMADKDEIKVEVTEEEIANAYASINVSHILLGTMEEMENPLTEEEAKKKADEVYDKVMAGEDWNELAKEYSSDTSNKDNGGNLGEIRVSDFKLQFDQDFVQGALALKKGEVSKPVKTQFGYHIIKVIDRKEASGSEFEKRSEELRAELTYQKFRADTEQYQQWIDARVAEADMTILDPALRAYQLKTEEKWAEAAEFYKKAMQMKQHRWDREVFLSALDVLARQEEWDEAVENGRKILKRFPEDMELNTAVGKVLYQRNKDEDKKEGLALLEKAQELAGEDTQLLTKIKDTYQALELSDKVKALEEEIDRITQAELKEQEELQKQMELEQKLQEEEANKAAESAETGDETGGTGTSSEQSASDGQE